MKLDKQDFARVIAAAPLVSVDLVVENEHGQVLLGRRVNRPAQDYWFVPGGRIRKNERVQDAVQRIALAELGVEVEGGQLIGVFDHFYPDNYFGIADLSTHYVVFGYRCRLAPGKTVQPDAQHAALQWWDQQALLTSETVHDNSKLYFRPAPGNGLRCRCD